MLWLRSHTRVASFSHHVRQWPSCSDSQEKWLNTWFMVNQTRAPPPREIKRSRLRRRRNCPNYQKCPESRPKNFKKICRCSISIMFLMLEMDSTPSKPSRAPKLWIFIVFTWICKNPSQIFLKYDQNFYNFQGKKNIIFRLPQIKHNRFNHRTKSLISHLTLYHQGIN